MALSRPGDLSTDVESVAHQQPPPRSARDEVADVLAEGLWTLICSRHGLDGPHASRRSTRSSTTRNVSTSSQPVETHGI